MRLFSRLILGLGSLLALTVACSSSSTTDSGTLHDASSPHDSATSADSGGAGTSLSGTSRLTFTPTFVGWGKASGGCMACAGLPMPGLDGSVSGGGSFPSGPASYDGLVVLLSDDPNLQASCTADAADGYSFDFSTYHYLTLQVTSTETIATGTYAIHSSLSQSDGGVSYAAVVDSIPVPSDASSGIGYNSDDNGAGTLTITGLGSTVQGTFKVTGLELFGAGSSQGDLSGSFDAPSCPSLAVSAFEGPCGGCPG